MLTTGNMGNLLLFEAGFFVPECNVKTADLYCIISPKVKAVLSFTICLLLFFC